MEAANGKRVTPRRREEKRHRDAAVQNTGRQAGEAKAIRTWVQTQLDAIALSEEAGVRYRQYWEKKSISGWLYSEFQKCFQTVRPVWSWITKGPASG